MQLTDVLVFLPVPPESSFLYVGIYDLKLVALSVAIAIFASFAALGVADRVRLVETPGMRFAWLALGSLAMGGGIWAMHFIGMLALQLPCSTRYDTAITLWSMLPGVLASAVAIEVMRLAQASQWRVLGGSVLLGAGIVPVAASGNEM